MKYNYGSVFRILRENKNISISSLADEYISKGMISKFERDTSDISVSRFFHLLEKIKISPDEFFFSKNQYKSEGFNELLSIIQKCVLTNNITKLKNTLKTETNKYKETANQYYKLNCIMLAAVIMNMENNKNVISDENLHILTNYLFKCENWGYYELTLYANSMSALPINSIIAFSKSLPQKILSMKSSNKILELGFNVILNTLDLCMRFNKKETAKYFLDSLENLNLPETMLFEHTLLKLYKGIYITKFKIDYPEDNNLIEEALTIFKLAGSIELHAIFSKNVQELLNQKTD